MNLAKITTEAEKVSNLAAMIHRACELRGHDGKTTLQRIASEGDSFLRAARYDSDPSGSSDREIDQADPEALTSPPAYSDPTGETVASRAKNTAARDGKRIAEKLAHLTVVLNEVIDIMAAYPAAHTPTQQELELANKIERENAADRCQSCEREDFDVLASHFDVILNHRPWRLCEWCADTVLKTDMLPTRAQVKDRNTIEPKRRSA